jgi:carbamoyl-phosphate synthase small subunit
VVDFGVKKNILRRLTQEGARVVVIPPENAQRTIEQIKPSAIFLSNGPGDPQRVVEGIRLVRAYMEKLPIMGICLGHQIIGLALGGRTYKLRFGHHGGNHPVKDLRTGRIHITAQNHNFAVEPESLKDVELTHCQTQ